jgi:hypothetical protein
VHTGSRETFKFNEEERRGESSGGAAAIVLAVDEALEERMHRFYFSATQWL